MQTPYIVYGDFCLLLSFCQLKVKAARGYKGVDYVINALGESSSEGYPVYFSM